MNSTVHSIPILALLTTSLLAHAQPPAPPAPVAAPPAAVPPIPFPVKPFLQEVPAAAYKIEMVPIPGDGVKNIKPLWFSKTEITWEAFDVYIYRLDDPKAALNNPDATTATAAGVAGPDGITRPTKPYLPPDRGFGHEGFAAIGMSKLAAAEFCTWLSKKTGRVYRLPTEEEWEHACLAGNEGPYCFGSDVAQLPDYAWFADDADDAPHAVAKKKPNAWGLYDMHGNVAEWCETPDGKGVVKGGSYKWSADEEKATARKPVDRAWNASDPQMPKSKWWLANGQFIGFRIVCESPDLKPVVPEGKSEQKPEPKPDPKAEPKPEPKKDAKP
jgi:formylglycine-generating enzyme required for sulfatase activity